MVETSLGSEILSISAVAPEGEEDVREDQVEARVPVPAVPDGEPVEAGETLEPRQPRQQHDLQERGVGAEEPGDARDAREQLAAVVNVGDVAAVRPEPHDHPGVAENDGPHEHAGEDAPGGLVAPDADLTALAGRILLRSLPKRTRVT